AYAEADGRAAFPRDAVALCRAHPRRLGDRPAEILAGRAQGDACPPALPAHPRGGREARGGGCCRRLTSAVPPVLILPGLGNSGPEHWQTHGERQNPNFTRVEQRDWDKPDREDWIATLDKAIGAQPTPPLLVAHSLSCALVAHWAARHA